MSEKIRRLKDKVKIGKTRRTCLLFAELNAAARSGYGSPVYGYVPHETKKKPRGAER